MRLKDLLKGKTDTAQQAIDKFFSTIDQEKILWYPSAGNDFRDVMEVTQERLELHQIHEQPNIICHTDYSTFSGIHENYCHGYSDTRTWVRIREQHPLVFASDTDICYEIRDEYAFTSFAARNYYHKRPIAYFLELEICSKKLGRFNANLFYFIFENYNFLEQVILKHKLAITHFVKVRQGCGFGGCRKCISVFYSLLGTIGVKYLLVDYEIQYCQRTHDRLAEQFDIKHQNYELTSIGMPIRWSDYLVKPYKVNLLPGPLNNHSFNKTLSIIYGTSSIMYGDLETNRRWESLPIFPDKNQV